MNSEDETKPAEGLRFNSGKLRTDLIPFDVIWQLAAVITKGSAKYADRNWENGMSWMICVGCLMRHLIKFVLGEDYDEETKLPHIDHVVCNAVFLSRYFRRNKDKDDRPVGFSGSFVDLLKEGIKYEQEEK